MRRGFAYASPYTLTPGQPSPGMDYLPASPHRLPTTSSGRAAPPRHPEGLTGFKRLASPGSALARHSGYGNINPLSIDYACRPRLRSRLTLGGLAWPRNPWSFGGRSFSLRLSLLMPAFSLVWRPRLDHSAASLATRRSPTHPRTWTHRRSRANA